MSDKDLEEQRRLRRAAVTRHGVIQPPEPEDVEETTPDEDDPTARRLEQQSLWVELQVRQAMARGDFDDLPGAGKPLRLPDRHDPDWWVKQLVERENISVAPPAIALRREDAELDDTIDREAREEGVRRVVEDFNHRVVEARRQLTGGPPVITKTRDPDSEVEAWRERRAQRAADARQRARERQASQPRPRRRSLFRRRPDAG
jgi:DnaJ homologue, subfamily C, member 28, conserved domain